MSRPSREDLDRAHELLADAVTELRPLVWAPERQRACEKIGRAIELLDGTAEPEPAPDRRARPGAAWVPRLAAALVAVWVLYVLASVLVGG